MVTERSLMTARSIFGSMDFFSCGSSALIASTTLMMFAPGCWVICTCTAGLPLYRPKFRMFSVAPSWISLTCATSPKRTVAPLRLAMISER